MQNFFFNPSGQMPPGLSKKQAPPSFTPMIQSAPGVNNNASSPFQPCTLEKLNQFLNDPNMRQLLKDIINHTNVIYFLKVDEF